MRTEVTYIPPQLLGRRSAYVRDFDGRHGGKGLAVDLHCVGFRHPDELVRLARKLGSKRNRGRPRKFVALELTVHPSDEARSRDSFSDKAEMRWVAAEVLNEFHAVYALVAYHGLRDIHVLALNWGPTGLALKSYLPNRSNPRRVLAATCDRIERQMIRERIRQGKMPLRSMADVRAAKRTACGRVPLHREIAHRLPPNREPSIADILESVRRCGWFAIVRQQKVSISFAPSRPPRRFELDLFLRGVFRAWLEIQRERRPKHERQTPTLKDPAQNRRKPPFEELTKEVYRFMQGANPDQSAREWLVFGSDGIIARDCFVAHLATSTAQEMELNAVLKAANEILTKRKSSKLLDRGLAGPAQTGRDFSPQIDRWGSP